MTITALRSAIDSFSLSSNTTSGEFLGHAAIAMVFGGEGFTLSLCFIQRAINRSDPWSGQMALPGGRSIPEDGNLQRTAIRETWEEVGLNLMKNQCLGVLPQRPIVAKGRATGGSVTPYVYYWGVEMPGLAIDPTEVAAAVWIPVWELRHSSNRLLLNPAKSGLAAKLPAVRSGSRIIWGMTYHVIFELFDRAERYIDDK